MYMVPLDMQGHDVEVDAMIITLSTPIPRSARALHSNGS